MKHRLAAPAVATVICCVGALGTGFAAADETAYAVGGAKVPGVPWYDYTNRIGRGYHPTTTRVIVDYPAGQIQGRLPEILWPGRGLGGPSVGQSVVTGSDNLDATIRGKPGPGVAIGLSEGALVLNAEQTRLAGDPTAPPPDQLSFSVVGDPAGSHGFGKSFLATVFPPGTFVPVIDYTMPNPLESQYDSTKIVGAYDAIADFPDRPWNPVAVANALAAAGFVHTAAGFTSPADVPPENIITTTNSRGATTTTYLVPAKYLPLTLPLRYLGVPGETVDQIDAVLQPMVDAGYSRFDHASGPTGVDPVIGLDPWTVVDPAVGLDPTTRANLDGFLEQARGILPPDIG